MNTDSVDTSKFNLLKLNFHIEYWIIVTKLRIFKPNLIQWRMVINCEIIKKRREMNNNYKIQLNIDLKLHFHGNSRRRCSNYFVRVTAHMARRFLVQFCRPTSWVQLCADLRARWSWGRVGRQLLLLAERPCQSSTTLDLDWYSSYRDNNLKDLEILQQFLSFK